ncbi:MAG TPA: YihY/virulence factor BrkB family protein [Solirubrobacteraceae bacterium]|nr:YihY/virulence factor BrkB family protein [Solirubrobacteraceae bacterium]
MDILRPVRTFDRFQQRHRGLAIPMAVLKKFSDDGGGQLAAMVTYYAFLSLFPLLLVMVTVLGFVLQGDAGAAQSIENSVLAQFPVIGDYIKVHALTGHIGALVIGVLISLWGGLGITNAIQNSFAQIWAVPRKDRPDFLQWRLKGLGLILSLGGLFIVSTAVSGLVTGLGGPWVKVGAIVISLLVNFTLFLCAFRFMTPATIGTSRLWIGVVTASVLWVILQLVGGIYINHVYRHASSVYSQFALVIALLIWLRLGAQVTLYSAEINTVLSRRLWPRTLIGDPEEPADQRTLAALAKVEERHDIEQVDVSFENGDEAQNSVSAAPRRVISSGQEQSPPSAGQP